MGSWNGRILFVDGFAGPGKYKGGELGSPLIALQSYRDHSALGMITAEVVFSFIEENKKRAEHLRQLVEEIKPSLPAKCKVEVIHGTFDESIAGTLAYLEEQKKKLAPAFVMVDPFGVKGTPMAVIRGILQNPRCEVYVSFMYEAINRWKNASEFEEHLDALFGCTDWRDGRSIKGSAERKQFFYDLFEQQLRDAGAKQVIRFELYNGNRLVYAIFFATQDITGADRMKEAIWKADPSGNFRFRGSKQGQLDLGLDEPNYEPLRQGLRNEYIGEDWISIEAILDFVSSDRTDYHRSQVKRNALKVLEVDGLLEVDEATRNRRGTYPEGTKVRFLTAAKKNTAKPKKGKKKS